MHFHRLSSLALGAWLGGTLVVLLFSMQNVRLADELIRTPAKEAEETMVKLQESDLRLLMSYHAAEGNRWMRRNWELAGLGLGVAVLLSLFFGAGGKRYTMFLCLLMITATAFQHWFLTPEIEKLARAADFAPVDSVSAARDRLQTLESGYLTAETLTLVLGLLLSGGLVRRGRRRRQEIEPD